MPAGESQFNLPYSREEEFIRREVERRLYERELPCGGAREHKWVDKFKKLGRDDSLNEDAHKRAWLAARKWSEIDGWYYQRRPLTEKNNKPDWTIYTQLRDASTDRRDWEKKWFAQMMLDGLPERLADFRMDCLFLLKRADGHMDRLVRLRNVVNERTGLERLDSEALHAPQKFRRWCLDKGNFHWGAGEKELHKLHRDIGRGSAWRTVKEVVACGWLPLKERRQEEAGAFRPERGLWFYDDLCMADGRRLDADEFGIYWHDDAGYQLSETGREGKFHQKRPKLRPGFSITQARIDLSEETCRRCGYDDEAELADGDKKLSAFFREFSYRLKGTLGGHDAWMMIGSFLAYAAAPEIYERHSMFPGLWVHGQASSGKTTVLSWLMRLWGFEMTAGLDMIKNVTAVGMQMAAEQYANLPVWLDEFRNGDVGDDKVAILRSALNRGEQAKWTADGLQREIKTAFVVSGESTSSDAATRSRYPHVLVAASRREANHMEWFNKHSPFFFLFGRFLMERRAEFSESLLRFLESWRENPAAAGMEERNKLVHGVSFAAFKAMACLLQSHSGEEMGLLQKALLAHAREAGVDVVSELNINVFWTDLITAFKADAVPKSCFRIEWDNVEHPPGAPAQGHWPTFRLFIDPDQTLTHLQMFLTKSRSQISLKRKDLRDQLSRNPYWIEGKHSKRFIFGDSRATTKCWGIEVDKHPLGYQPVSDEQYDAMLFKAHEGDPRKGDLFVIVDAILKMEKDREKQQANLEVTSE